MSSRRDLAAQQQRLAAEQVQYAKQCQFWTRSLDRNDTDSAAVIELNRRLHELKKLLDPEVLLDIGQGFIRLAQDGTDTLVNDKLEPITKLDPKTYRDSVEFVLRRKLRRKLLNRIFRRLNRLAAAMDGNLEIPAPPKYGDLRLECDRAVVREFYEAQILQDKAHLALAVKRDLDDLLGISGGKDVAMQVTEEVSSSGEPVKGAQQISNSSSPLPKEPPEALKIKDERPDVMPSNETASSESPPNPVDAPLSNDAISETPAEVCSDKKPQENETTDTDVSDPFDFQSALLKDYKDAFERAVDKKGNVTYTLFARDDPAEPPDYLGAGIGATSRHMSSKEREVEYHRWQTTLLARIPEQPTFEELGLEHRVFGLAERREEVAKLKEKMIEGDPSEEEKQISQENVPINSDTEEKDDIPMDVEKSSSNPSEEAKQEDDKAETSVSDDDGKKEDEVDDEAAKDDEDEGDAPQKVVRPISLIPVPSFYEQDLRRIKNVHADLIHVSLQNHARHRLEESAAEYNTAFKASHELLKRRTHISEQIRAILYDQQQRRHGMQHDHLQFNAERNRWHSRRQQFEHQKLNAMLPSRNNRPSQGTHLTKRYRTLPDRSGIVDVVGDCLADVIDAVDAVARGLIRNEIFNERFIPPSGGEGNDSEQVLRLRQVEAARRNELNEVTLRINQLEEVRKKAWKKAMKTKAEFELPHHHISNNGTMQVVHVTMGNYSAIPMPILTQGSLLTVPKDIFALSSIKTYTPKKKSPSQVTKPAAKAGSSSKK